MPETVVAEGGASQVIVTGTPVGEGHPTPQGKALADRDHAAEAQKAETSNTLFDRLADSDLGYYDDNVANKRYIAKITIDDKLTPIGTPTHQLRRINWPTDDDARLGALQGVLVLREDGSFYSIPAGVHSLGAVVDPVSEEPLVGKIDTKRAKARAAASVAEEKPGVPVLPKAEPKQSSKGKK